MNSPSAYLAHRITWQSSKQSYLTALLLADRDLVDDCLRAYAYFRWADDMVDEVLTDREERQAFIRRQQELAAGLYRGERPDGLCPQERMLADLVHHDRGPGSGLRSFIEKFMGVIAFDANRRGEAISRLELEIYTERLGCAVMDGLLYFIGNGHPYTRTPQRFQAVIGAHMTHMLRDMLEDLPLGFINIPQEDLEAGCFALADAGAEASRCWVRGQVAEARGRLRRGLRYIETLDLLRCKLAGVWYCARFELVLEAIERDGYRLRCSYPERKNLQAWLRMLRLGLVVAAGHFFGKLSGAAGQACSKAA
ncbi:MAG: squalene/phytoene synthase family protein [Anaerolineales bacterium]|nr:squalene/phytoene synthase family protein [Anaerolineales bacterium]